MFSKNPCGHAQPPHFEAMHCVWLHNRANDVCVRCLAFTPIKMKACKVVPVIPYPTPFFRRIRKYKTYTVATSATNDFFSTDSSPLVIDTDTTWNLTMSSPGKAPMNTVQQGPGPISAVNGSSRPGGTNLISVEPPKQSDLQVGAERITDSQQPSFAHVMPEDPANMGWYGKMIDNLGGFCGALGSIPCCICCPNPYKQGFFFFWDF